MQIQSSSPAKAALATLREHLDFECAEVDSQGRYVLDFEAMNEVVDALDDIEEALGEDGSEESE
jgi:hypothetical protein